MNIKRFVAKDMREAIRKVKVEHGPDAVILKSKSCPGGVEVLSATNFDRSLFNEAAESSVREAQTMEREFAVATATERPQHMLAEMPQEKPVRTGISSADSAWQSAAEREAPVPDHSREPVSTHFQRQDRALETIRRELRVMKGLLRTELAGLVHEKYQRDQPVRSELVRRLTALEWNERSARALADRIDSVDNVRTAWKELLALIELRMPHPERSALERGGRIAMVGPTGVGKTSTVAKLAGQYAKRHGRRSVAIIGTDNLRAGAVRELLELGQQLGVYTLIATSHAELRESLDVVSDRSLVLVDTAGLGQHDPRLPRQRSMIEEFPQLETWLVLAANMSTGVVDDLISSYARHKMAASVITKMDEAANIGGLLSILMDRGLPVALTTAGRHIPDDLSVATSETLVNDMVQIELRRRQRAATDNAGLAADGRQIA